LTAHGTTLISNFHHWHCTILTPSFAIDHAWCASYISVQCQRCLIEWKAARAIESQLLSPILLLTRMAGCPKLAPCDDQAAALHNVDGGWPFEKALAYWPRETFVACFALAMFERSSSAAQCMLAD
jgi:hypothetical protein